jgi:hypothetical protein
MASAIIAAAMAPTSTDAMPAVARNAVPAARCPRTEVDDILHTSNWDLRARLQGYAFLAGLTFVVAHHNSSRDRAERILFRCVHWGEVTRNTREIAADKRQRDRTVAKPAYPLSIYVSYIVERGVKVITAASWSHSHDPYPNPLLYSVYRWR